MHARPPHAIIKRALALAHVANVQGLLELALGERRIGFLRAPFRFEFWEKSLSHNDLNVVFDENWKAHLISSG
jgi:hypothetical protein